MIITYLDNLKYFLVRSFEDLISNQLESLPVKFQKLWRILKFVLKLNFIACSNYLRVSDLICTNYTEVLPIDTSDLYDQIFASRQELFSLSYVKYSSVKIY